MSLLVVGTVAFDAIETPFGKTEKILGGAATYIALAASYFTNKINVISIVGDDFPEKYNQLLTNHSIDIEGIEKVTGQKSFFWSGKYHNDMNSRDTILTELNVLADFKPKVPQKYQDCQYLMLGNLSPDVQLQVIEQLKVRPKLIAMDTMNYWMDNAMDDLRKVLSKVDILTINDEEARQLSGEYSLVKAARKILKIGLKYLIIKKGEHGALLFTKNQIFFAPALPLEDVFDPTGAGDTFAGGFMGYLVKTKFIDIENIKRAVIYGSAMASFTVEKFGVEKLLEIDNNQIEDRVKEFINLVYFDLIV